MGGHHLVEIYKTSCIENKRFGVRTCSHGWGGDWFTTRLNNQWKKKKKKVSAFSWDVKSLVLKTRILL